MNKFITVLLLSLSLSASASPLGCVTYYLMHRYGMTNANNGKEHAVKLGNGDLLEWTSGMTFPGVWGFNITEYGSHIATDDAAGVLFTRAAYCHCLGVPGAQDPTKESYSGTCSTIG